jgi:hypothetical protein
VARRSARQGAVRSGIERVRSEVEMTSTIEQESINEALALIDKELVKLVKRDLIATIEVADLLLDVRALLSSSDNDDKPN